MKHYYDPWGHAASIVRNRLVLFFTLVPLAGFGLWWWILERYLGMHMGLADAAVKVWAVLFYSTVETDVCVIFCLSMAVSALATGWGMTLAHCLGRLWRGESHHRGARIVYRDGEA